SGISRRAWRAAPRKRRASAVRRSSRKPDAGHCRRRRERSAEPPSRSALRKPGSSLQSWDSSYSHEQNAAAAAEFQPLRPLNITGWCCCMRETQGEERVKQALERARLHSPFLRQQLDRFPAIADALGRGDCAGALELAERSGE